LQSKRQSDATIEARREQSTKKVLGGARGCGQETLFDPRPMSKTRD